MKRNALTLVPPTVLCLNSSSMISVSRFCRESLLDDKLASELSSIGLTHPAGILRVGKLLKKEGLLLSIEVKVIKGLGCADLPAVNETLLFIKHFLTLYKLGDISYIYIYLIKVHSKS